MSTKPSQVSTFTPAFGNRLSAVLELVGGLVGASKMIGVTDEQIGRWRSGRSKPQFFGLATLCDATGVSLDWLATGEGAMHRAAAGPAESGPTAAPADAAALDEELLALAVEVVEEWLAERRATIPPARKAQAVAALYEIGLEDGGNLAPRQVARILRLVA